MCVYVNRYVKKWICMHRHRFGDEEVNICGEVEGRVVERFRDRSLMVRGGGGV